MLRRYICLFALLVGTAGAVRAETNDRLEDVLARFRALRRAGAPHAPKAARLAVLREIAKFGTDKAFQFLAETLGDARQSDLSDDLLRFLADVGKDSAIVAAVFEKHFVHGDPYRLLARDFLVDRSVQCRDDDWLLSMFQGGRTEDRFRALAALGEIKSRSTLRCAWKVLEDKRWKVLDGTPVHWGTVARALASFEGEEAARLLLLLKRDPRYRTKDAAALRDATRLWASIELLRYVRIADLAHPVESRRADSARFMGRAGVEAARAPLLFLAQSPDEASEVRAAAAEALGGLSIARGDLARRLAELARDADDVVSRAAVRGLARLRVQQSAAALIALFGTPLEADARAALAAAHGLPATHDWPAWLRKGGLPKGT